MHYSFCSFLKNTHHVSLFFNEAPVHRNICLVSHLFDVVEASTLFLFFIEVIDMNEKSLKNEQRKKLSFDE